jgi:hypothetical protein
MATYGIVIVDNYQQFIPFFYIPERSANGLGGQASYEKTINPV